MQAIPVVDVTALRAADAKPETVERVAGEIGAACRDAGFFRVVGHGVNERLCRELETLCRTFFAQPPESKARIAMARGGRAWRGWFPVGAELTSGAPDQKEGLYLGQEHPADHPRVRAGTPLFGANLFPDLPGFRETALAYLDALTELGHALVGALALGLGLERDALARSITRDPIVLLRAFHYPRLAPDSTLWSVAEHTDYGLLTILRLDTVGGLEVKTRAGWVDVPHRPESFVCNIGDMLERMTGGAYRSTAHRVRNRNAQARLSLPFFFDPGFDAVVEPVLGERHPVVERGESGDERWDGRDVHAWGGTYGEYLLAKVARVFPGLGEQVL